jgi:hypothetical protein
MEFELWFQEYGILTTLSMQTPMLDRPVDPVRVEQPRTNPLINPMDSEFHGQHAAGFSPNLPPNSNYILVNLD